MEIYFATWPIVQRQISTRLNNGRMTKTKMQKHFVFSLVVFTALIFYLAGGTANAESFGIKFLGNTTDGVTGAAGMVPISGWTNIANANNAFTSGIIHSSDGTASATLSLSGSGRANAWNSGTTADGGNGSLMRGYCDAMVNGPVTATISGLTGSSYAIYLYTQADAQRPSGTGDWIPNYTINGISVFTPTIAPVFNRFIQGGMSPANTNLYPTGLANGNYIRWNNGIPVNGVITISANSDNRSYRSPLNGIELVLNSNPPPSQTRPIRIMPLGDSITWGYPNAPTTGGYRLPLYQLLTNESFSMDFVGTQVSTAPGLLYPNHEGHSGFRIDQIDDPYFLGWVNTVASPDIILLLIGTNDLGQNYDPTNAIVRLDGLISHITTDRPNAKVIVANLLARSDTNANNMINTLFNPFVPGVVAQHVANGEPVYFWDLHSQLTVADTDGLHPLPSGYIKIANQWFNAINAIYAPFNGFNLAFNKTATASSVNGSNGASNAVDGNATSYWSSATSDPQWLSVDLGTMQNIYRVNWIWTAAYGKSYQVQISTDNTNWASVYNTTAGLGGTNSISFAPVNTRYVRIYGTAQATGLGYGLSELQVYATPPVNLALNKTAIASSTSDAVNFPATKVVDGNATTHWSSTAHDVEWVTVDLGSAQRVGRVRLSWDAAYGQGYEIQFSADNLNWTRVYNTSSGTGGTDDVSFAAVNTRYVRMYGLQRGTTNGYSLNEFSIYGPLDAGVTSQFPPLIGIDANWVPSAVYLGQNASASVTVGGTLPLFYQWKAGLNGNFTNLVDGVNISGSTNATLMIANAQFTNALNYVVIVTNLYGSATSSVAALAVTSPLGTYASAVVSKGPVAFWELNETGDPAASTVTAFDYVGGYNGIYGAAAKNGNALYNIPGPQPPTYPGFPANNLALQTMRTAGSGVTVPALNLQNTNVTIVAWIYPTNTEAGSSAIFLNRTAGTIAGFAYVGTAVNGAYPLGYVWNNNEGATWSWAGSNVFPPVNQWSMVALTITANNCTIYCWSPTGSQQGSFIHAHNNMTFAGISQIGNDHDFASKNFLGNIDSVAVFNYNLSSNVLQNLYYAGANHAPTFLGNPFTVASVTAGQPYAGTLAGSASDSDGDPMSYAKVSGPNWLTVSGNGNLGGTALSGNVGTNIFVVSVADPSGSINTANMKLTVLAAPPIVASAGWQGSSLMLNWGGGIGPYQVQITTNLVNANWQNVGATISSTSLLVETTNATAFYRVLGQ
ncbi:MAG TPA: discoidin domain-containing protein [Verrucomicrobiae bacterium]|nr:discoidin domain-containing protein [Verrucomicrobiae bacterium]